MHDEKQNSHYVSQENRIAIAIIKEQYNSIKALVWMAIGISGINFIVILVMLIQLQNEIFKAG